ncbi:MAG TPA: MBL fold metallo-hydrolase [Acidimicrobiales bacterium]|nr:Zn-dependent hydrolase [Actinomycetota bacterium]MDP6062727.1 MBL fold metallo-hydrolase [Acidimicrobiales bacterium]MDP6213540.1 MBL fold metallo-hydrolase [Acidimicrobiales bacterium]MDP7208347.1 MBL fold metallo-hydrolase [Acidimicrobiales bacterium]HJL88842.1 MBL fold metallo-hydrolase [Acidimicrobiales bacterium]
MTLRIDHVVTNGVFSLDGEDFDVDNNIWIIGDERDVVVVDAAHDHRPILEAVAGRNVLGVLCTHGHNDHINAAAQLAEDADAPIWLHPDDSMLWDVVYPDRRVDDQLRDGASISVGGEDLSILHTPGHSPGGCCVYSPTLGTVFSGDTLFNGGPGATGRSFSSYDLLVESIHARLLVLPEATVVHTGHGDSTTIGDEARNLDG